MVEEAGKERKLGFQTVCLLDQDRKEFMESFRPMGDML